MAYQGIKKTHQLMKEKLIDYIKSQYFGENELLLNASDELLNQEGDVYRKPYIESTPSYIKVSDGIAKSSLDIEAKVFFQKLIENHLGVYKTPFKHQIDSLEAFSNEKNLFVATGTGSGKTECFMWPILYKLFKEAKNNPEQWKKRGVRTLVIYPMNALVSDQIARLRSIIGEDKFENLFYETTGGRRPQFGMYTGRTPYPGEKPSKKYNHEIAESYRNSYLISDELSDEAKHQRQLDIDGLKKIHKYPSKDVETFVRSLEEDQPSLYNNEHDAELITRFEMQKTTPDILITNYSMLEYMLIRENEAKIWNETRCWLALSKENKLLIVLDEAHMYSGASGGEVALLLRRLLSRLNITPEQANFIFTSASMPFETEEDKNSIFTFSSDLSGCESESFEYLFGEKDEFKIKNGIQMDVSKLANLSLEMNDLTEDRINEDISLFAKEIFGVEIHNGQRQWLYDHLPDYEPFAKLFKLCRGNAVSYDELLDKVIGRNDELAEKALENLLLIAPLAKDMDGNVLLPARMHAFFRGLNGLYACVNPDCKKKHEGDHLHLGKLFTSRKEQCPECNGKVYELINDRRCGALYIKGYILGKHKNDFCQYFWQSKGIDNASEMIEYPLYICPDNYDVKERPKDTKVCYLDIYSGKLYQQKPNSGTMIQVLAPDSVDDDGNGKFSTCPKCGKKFRFYSLSDFSVKGNLPFYNIVKAQFDSEPATKESSKYIPNGGRKVLLFSDSRQSAAILARDMTKIADMDSFRKTIYMAMYELYQSENLSEFSMSALYTAFLKISYENNLRFFYGDDLNRFEEDKERIHRYIDRCNRHGRKFEYSKMIGDFNTPSTMYQAYLIELFCSPTMNFMKLGLGYIIPLEDKLEEAVDTINEDALSDEEFERIFLSFVYKSFTDSYAFDNLADDSTRRQVKYIKGNRYGFGRWSSYESETVKAKYPFAEKIYKTIVETFYRKEGDNYFLNLDSVKMKLTPEGEHWTRCRQCGEIQPFDLDGHCSICDSTDIHYVDCKSLAQIDYWRKPILSKEPIKSINTEEHTAQLSHKDEKVQTWAKTEDYEMRFQDVNVEKEGTVPIDILSCTTTMEVGIDIGSLVAIGLRNVPPLRENYQQRAGRAGRRGSSLSTITTYAQNGPHDNYYFRNPEKIIRGKPRKPWIDIHNQKLIGRHFNLIALTKYFEDSDSSLYTCKIDDFRNELNDFDDFLNDLKFSPEESKTILLDVDIEVCKKNLIRELNHILNEVPSDRLHTNVFDYFFEKGIMPTYSFPLDVVTFNVENNNRELLLAPQRSIDLAISEFAPGRTLVIDKKTYKSGGIYNHIPKEGNPFKQALPYFEEKAGYYQEIFMCSNPLCGWFGTKRPKDGHCPFCGQPLSEHSSRHMLKPWGFAPLNGKDIPENEAVSDMSYSEEPCYSATPSEDLVKTKYKNLLITNRNNEEIIVLNKGNKGRGFDVCMECGAAQLHDGKTLKENGVEAPYFLNNGSRVNCAHKNVAEGIFLGASFRTDMFFMQIEANTDQITKDSGILHSAVVTLSEAMHLAASRILDIEYNDIKVGNRIRMSGKKRYIDIYFYDGLSSGAGYSTQIKSNLDEILNESISCLSNDDNRDISNFWNQRLQYLFNKKLGLNLLEWLMKGKLPTSFDRAEVMKILVPVEAVLKSETNEKIEIIDDRLEYRGKTFKVIPGFCNKRNAFEITDFEIRYSLPLVINRISGKSVQSSTNKSDTKSDLEAFVEKVFS